jgi:hypothetical protein
MYSARTDSFKRMLGSGCPCQTSCPRVRAQQAGKVCLLQNQAFAEAPGATSPLVLEIDPLRPGTRMPEGLPEHREIVAIRAKPDDMSNTDPLGIAALKPIRDVQREALARAPAAQKALIPTAWC